MSRKLTWIFIGGAVLLLGACGSEESKIERGIAVESEVAVPESEHELEMTGAEREAAELSEEEQHEALPLEEDREQ